MSPDILMKTQKKLLISQILQQDAHSFRVSRSLVQTQTQETTTYDLQNCDCNAEVQSNAEYFHEEEKNNQVVHTRSTR